MEEKTTVIDIIFFNTLGLLSNIGGLISISKISVAVCFGGLTLKYYKKSIATTIIKEDEAYSDSSKKEVVKMVMERLDSVNIFRLYD